jgi:hypothetical protein
VQPGRQDHEGRQEDFGLGRRFCRPQRSRAVLGRSNQKNLAAFVALRPAALSGFLGKALQPKPSTAARVPKIAEGREPPLVSGSW